MSTFTLEELMLQILSTCLLVNAQGKWHAFYNLHAHIGELGVRLVPSDNDYQADQYKAGAAYKSVTFTTTNRHPWPEVPEVTARQDLIQLLTWTQGFLSMEVAA